MLLEVVVAFQGGYFEMQHPLTHMGAFIANAIFPLCSRPFVCCEWLQT